MGKQVFILKRKIFDYNLLDCYYKFVNKLVELYYFELLVILLLKPHIKNNNIESNSRYYIIN